MTCIAVGTSTRYTAICIKHTYYVTFARGRGVGRTAGPCERNGVDSLTLGFEHGGYR